MNMDKKNIEDNVVSLMCGNISMSSRKIEMFSLHQTSKYKTKTFNQAIDNA